MRSRLLPYAVLVFALLGGGWRCAPPPASQGAAAQPAAPAGTSAASTASAGSQAEWDRTMAAARQEGKLALSGPPGQLWRDALLTFERDYPEIKVEFTGQNSRDFWPRVAQERGA